ncbi:MAG: hypothetical protein GWP03_01600 [Proteobacteria bacterium]|nr:hypothetical protein [Pseudomonadota bacterium]
MSNLAVVSLFGESYQKLNDRFILNQSRFRNVVGEYSFNEFVDGYNFTKSNFVIRGRNFIKINTIRGNDTIDYERIGNRSFIITDHRKIPIKNRIEHWTDIKLPERGRIVGESMLFNVMCYHILSDSIELWMSKEDNIPVMIVYKGRAKVKVVISSYIDIGDGLLFPAECTIFVNDKFYSRNSIRNFKYTGG